MKKKLVAAAVTGALGAVPAVQADTANVNVYGKFYPAYTRLSGGETGNASTPTATLFANRPGNVDHEEIMAFNSYIGFRANLDVGGGMKAIMQVEQSVELDTGNEDATWANRNSAAGIEGGFGTVLLGRWDTPFKELHFPLGMFGVSSGSPVSNSNLMSRTPFRGGSATSFHRRQDNAVMYWSPDFNGFQAKVMYGTEEAKTAALDPRRISGTLVYEKGPLMIGGGYETHKDFFGLSSGLTSGNGGTGTGSDDTGIGVTAQYKISKDTTVAIDVESIKWEISGNVGATAKDYKRTAVNVAVEHKVGKWTVVGNVAVAQDGSCSLADGTACSTDGLGATQTSVGAKYDLAKNLSVYGWYTTIKNDNSASYSFITGTGQSGTAPTGADPKAWAIGLLTRF